jgi:hypothetical protein
MASKDRKYRSIKYGDPRVFFESTTTKPFKGPNGIERPVGSVVRGSAFVDIGGQQVSLSLPSMAELIFFQSKRDLDKAEAIKSRALKTTTTDGSYHLVDEELFYTYIQLLSLGLLGLYSSLESMVYELYIRKNKERKVEIDGKELTFPEFTAKGFVTKVTKLASQLSGKSSIYGTELMEKVNEVNKLRTSIQHWDVERREGYFVNLPDNHPLKVFVNVSPSQLAENIRQVLDHYSLKENIKANKTTQ